MNLSGFSPANIQSYPLWWEVFRITPSYSLTLAKGAGPVIQHWQKGSLLFSETCILSAWSQHCLCIPLQDVQ